MRIKIRGWKDADTKALTIPLVKAFNSSTSDGSVEAVS